jgi:hypothetical protein
MILGAQQDRSAHYDLRRCRGLGEHSDLTRCRGLGERTTTIGGAGWLTRPTALTDSIPTVLTTL